MAASLGLLLVAGSRTGHAAVCPMPSKVTAELQRFEASERLALLRAGMRHAARRARLWSWTFGTLHAAGTVARLAVLPAVSPEARPTPADATAPPDLTLAASRFNGFWQLQAVTHLHPAS